MKYKKIDIDIDTYQTFDEYLILKNISIKKAHQEEIEKLKEERRDYIFATIFLSLFSAFWIFQLARMVGQ